QARDTGYEPDDFVDVRVERGGESVRLLRLEGEAALTQRAGAGYARLVAALPPQWETATLSISSSSDSSAGSERFDFDSIAFFPIESSRTIGYTDFREPAVGAPSYAPPADGRELGFATVSTPTGGALLEVGVAEHDAPLRPRRLVHRSAAATTTFETVDLSDEGDAIARVVLRVLDTGYESDDYLRVHVTDGTEQVDILDASGDGGLGGLAGGEYMSYEAVIPSDWRRATLVISSSSDSSSGAEGFDIRCVEIVTRPAPSCEAAPAGIRFRRGDSNSDGDLDLSDGIRILGYLFLGGSGISCLDAADTDDSGAIDISDGVRIFNYLFLGGAPPAAPGHLDCGIDPTADALTCDVYSPCE
ncbi:MAG: hypothetical protein JXA90_00940, partial [Planctomycetes bacterium]|nr:hypothetical protein [Planctomycetota bacterium]